MRKTVPFSAAATVPEPAEVLRRQQVPQDIAPSPRVRQVLDTAMNLYLELASPQGLLEEIESADFARVYEGRGSNAPDSPLAGIYPAADRLALFAATTGAPVSARPGALFREGNLALAVMLDAVVSVAADRLATLLAGQYAAILRNQGRARDEVCVLPYAPGYCGWDVSGQAALFARLRPQEIGISLNESFLMSPLKSVSGVLVAGPARIHCFRPDYPFCEDCHERECLDRMALARRGTRRRHKGEK